MAQIQQIQAENLGQCVLDGEDVMMDIRSAPASEIELMTELISEGKLKNHILAGLKHFKFTLDAILNVEAQLRIENKAFLGAQIMKNSMADM